MTIAAVVLAAGAGTRFAGPGDKLRADVLGTPVLRRSVEAVMRAGYDDVIVVVGDDPLDDVLPDGVTVVQCETWREGQSHSLQAGVAAARELGHDAVVVGLGDQPLVGTASWRALYSEASSPIVATTYAGQRRPPTRLDASVWGLLPETGDAGARDVLVNSPDLVTEIASAGYPNDVDTEEALEIVRQRAADVEAVVELLGREPMGHFDVVARDEDDRPVVLKNFPLLASGRPMPTLYWLCGDRESILVGRLESMKGVRRAEADIGLDAIGAAHERYSVERDQLLEDSCANPKHRPTGGVGGTRQGVKCLHAHYGWWLAGGDDPVGQWVFEHLHEVDTPNWPSVPRVEQVVNEEE
jgi:CTP:molybdopterin cytidylyltransferase MocA